VGIESVLMRFLRVRESSFGSESSQYDFDFGCFLGGVSPFYGVFPDFVFLCGYPFGFYFFLELCEWHFVFGFEAFFDSLEEGEFFE